jgi:DNA-binding NarL/FixJ family response regulator
VSLVDGALVGSGRLVAVEGPAGIGKTRLLAAARKIAEERGLRVLSAQGSELEGAFPFGVVRQLLEPVLARTAETEWEKLFRGAARHARPLFAPDEGVDVPAGDVDYATLHGLYWLVVALAERQALMVCVDDLHWADAPSLRFLAFVARRLEGLPVLIAGALRPAEPGTDRSLVFELAGEPDADLLHPQPLTLEGVGEVICVQLGVDPEAGFVDACREATGGNPFYLRALLAEVAAQGMPPKAGNAQRVLGLGADGVSRLLVRRLNTLASGAVELAQAVAVLGDGVALGRAARLAGLDERSAADAAAALDRAMLVSGGDGLSFVHPIVRSSVYQDIPAAVRADRHARAARLATDDGAPPEDVAAQLVSAPPGVYAGAARVLAAAAERALGRGAPETAAAYLTRSLEELLPDGERAAVLVRLGQAQARFDLEASEGHLRQALEQPGAPPATRAAAALELGRALIAIGQTVDAVDVLGHVADELAAGAPEVAARLEAELLSVGVIDPGVSRFVAERARRLVAQAGAGDRVLEDAVLAWRACEAMMAGDSVEEARALVERALAGGTLREEGAAGGQLFFYVVMFLSFCERFDSAARYLDEAVEHARQAGSVIAYVVASAQRSWLGYRRGTLREAEADARGALDAARLNGLGPLELMAVAALSDALVERGEGQLVAREMASLPVDEAAGGSAQGCRALVARGHLRLALGETEAAVADLTQAGEQLATWGLRSPACFPWRSDAAMGLAALGRNEEAVRLADEELRLARFLGAPRAIGIALRARGLIAEGDQRDELLREAVAVLAGSGAALEHARALCDLGAALRRAGRRKEAREPLGEALELAHRCGALSLEERARVELLAAGARPRRPLRTGVDALTPSERRIAEMAASGMSNPEIAQALFLTIKTIEGHLSGVYRKLDVRSRTDLARTLES